MDEHTKGTQDEVPWCVLFTDDIVLIEETRDGLNNMSKQWRHTLESRGFILSKSKIEYSKCGLRGEDDDDEEVTISGLATPRIEKFST